MNENKLLPCPFCNGKPYYEKTICDLTIRCLVCGARILRKNMPNGKAILIKSWNTRSERKG